MRRHLLQHLAGVERSRALHGRVLRERLQVRVEHHHQRTFEPALLLDHRGAVRRFIPGFERVGPQVEDHGEGMPDGRCVVVLPGREIGLPLVPAHGHQLGLVVVDEVLAGAPVRLPGPVFEIIHAVDVLFATLDHLSIHVGFPRRGCQRGEEVHVGLDPVQDATLRNVPGPAHHRRHAHAAFVGRHLLAPEGRRSAMRPGTVFGTVVARVDDDRVVKEA